MRPFKHLNMSPLCFSFLELNGSPRLAVKESIRTLLPGIEIKMCQPNNISAKPDSVNFGAGASNRCLACVTVDNI